LRRRALLDIHKREVRVRDAAALRRLVQGAG
jgi:hypothetical protein